MSLLVVATLFLCVRWIGFRFLNSRLQTKRELGMTGNLSIVLVKNNIVHLSFLVATCISLGDNLHTDKTSLGEKFACSLVATDTKVTS